MVATAMPKQRTVSAHQRKPIAAVPHSAMTSAGTERPERDEKNRCIPGRPPTDLRDYAAATSPIAGIARMALL